MTGLRDHTGMCDTPVDYANYDRIKELMSPSAGEARATMLARLQVLFERATAGPWKTYQDGVHPVDVGGMGSGNDYAILTHGPKGFPNAQWIAAAHNDWPMIIDLLVELGSTSAARSALKAEGE